MLGAAQERWLGATLAQSRARWNLFGQGVIMAELKQPDRTGALGVWTDGWSAHPAARARFLRRLVETRAANPIVMTGDIHSFWTNDLKLDFEDERAPIVGTELIGTSITSTPPPYGLFAPLAQATPHVRYFESRRRGYVGLDIAPGRTIAAYRAISEVRSRDAGVQTLASFAIEDGRPGAVVA
jgi:alkaline phosphatase D